jgi:hypothetical protein
LDNISLQLIWYILQAVVAVVHEKLQQQARAALAVVVLAHGVVQMVLQEQLKPVVVVVVAQTMVQLVVLVDQE